MGYCKRRGKGNDEEAQPAHAADSAFGAAADALSVSQPCWLSNSGDVYKTSWRCKMKRWLKISIWLAASLLILAFAIVVSGQGGALSEIFTVFQSPLFQSPVIPPSLPLAKPDRTPTSIPPTIPPTPTSIVIPPPPSWPTGEPWPPQITPAAPPPVPTPLPFPTPAFPPAPTGQRPAQLQRVWFPYFPGPASSPQLQAVLVDRQGQRWAQEARSIDLRADPYPPGSVLLNLHPSPNHQWIIADLAFSGSYLLDLASGISRPLITDVYPGPGQFLAWSPDSRHVVVLPETFPQEVWIIDIVSQEHWSLDAPTSEFGDSLVRAAAYSPDGSQLADAVVYPPTVSKPGSEVEIGVRVGEQGTRAPLLRVFGGGMIAEHSLCWSPDGRILIFVADVHDGGRYTQLWAINTTDGTSRLLTTLAKEVQYNHPAVWSPDGGYIAAIKVEDARDGKSIADNVYLLDPVSGDERRITQFHGRRLSHLAWSPDGQRLAFTIAMGDYGEIWVTDLAGKQQYPIAGPAVPDAPFVWLP